MSRGQPIAGKNGIWRIKFFYHPDQRLTQGPSHDLGLTGTVEVDIALSGEIGGDLRLLRRPMSEHLEEVVDVDKDDDYEEELYPI